MTPLAEFFHHAPNDAAHVVDIGEAFAGGRGIGVPGVTGIDLMGASARAMLEGVIDRRAIGDMVEQALGVVAEVEERGGYGHVILRGGPLSRVRTLFVSSNDVDRSDVLPGMKTIVDTGVDPEGESILRGLLAFKGGFLCRSDSDDEWEFVPATVALDPSPEQTFRKALHELAGPGDATALVRICSDPDRRAALEAALATYRDAEPTASPRP